MLFSLYQVLRLEDSHRIQTTWCLDDEPRNAVCFNRQVIQTRGAYLKALVPTALIWSYRPVSSSRKDGLHVLRLILLEVTMSNLILIVPLNDVQS